MITYAAIVTGILAASGYAIYVLIKRHAEKRAEYEEAIGELESLVKDQTEELHNLENVIHELEEVNREEHKQKKRLKGSDPDDNLRTATDIMRELSGDDNQDGNETTPGD